MSEQKKVKIATTWLDGCSGCHMSFLDMDEAIIGLLDKIDIVYGPLVDFKDVPDGIDVALVEGAVATSDDLKKLKKLREKSAFLIAFGDCAVTGNVPGMRNPIERGPWIDRAYKENVTAQPQIPNENVPELLESTQPLHTYVKVDLFVQGCPPPTEAILYVLTELLEGRVPDPTAATRFGA